jgi:AAA domain
MDPKTIEKFLRRQQEGEQQGEFLATARAEMEKKGANERSIRIALTGLFEYMQATATYPEPPRPDSKHTPVAGGYFLNDFPSRPVDWLWQDRIPLAALTLLEGDPGIGKSLLALDLAARVSSGRPMPDGTPGKQGKVVLVAPHDSASRTIIPRLRAAGGNPSQVFLLTSVLDVDPKNGQLFYHPFSLPGDEHFLENIITRTEAVLVIIDTLDICQPHQRQRALPRLVDLADRTGCAFVLTRPRTTSRSGQDAPIHSTAPLDLRAFVSSSLLIAPYPGDSEQRFLITTRHPLAPQPKTLYYEILGPPNGAPIINWLGAEEHPDSRPEGPSGKLGILHILTLAALKDASRALGARELSSGAEEYENVRKLLNRMLHSGEVVSPVRGLYTLPGHPCLAQYPVLDPSTAPASPVPTVSSVPNIPATPTTPDLANDQDTNPQTAPVSIVPSVPITPAGPDPANDQDTSSQATSVPTVSIVPNTTSTPPTPTARQTRLTTPDESAGAWKSDPDQQPESL